MAIKISGTTVINDSRNIENIGIATATTFSGQVNAGVGTITTLNSTNANVTGVTTLGNVRVTSGIVTATTGIVTYYGDGQYLTGVAAAGAGGASDITANLFF
jgi:hypothetical protein